MPNNLLKITTAGLLASLLGLAGAASAETLRISSGIGQQHF